MGGKDRNYPYLTCVEGNIVRRLGTVVVQCTGTCFGSTVEKDIEHIMVRGEAHIRVRARDRATRAWSAYHMLNFALAAAHLNCHQKRHKDIAAWLPARNRSWFGVTVEAVRRACQQTVERREMGVLEGIIYECEATDLEPVGCSSATSSLEGVWNLWCVGDDVLGR